jgi:fatty-acyl-CoA synthase
MMDVPLTVTRIMQYGTSVYGDREVVTYTAAGLRRQTYAETGARAARLANALRSLGVDGDQRVATLMWNNSEHLEAYLAIPSMGAVLHTLNLRLDPETIGYIATHDIDDNVIIAPTRVPLLAQVWPRGDDPPRTRHGRSWRDGQARRWRPDGSKPERECTPTRTCSPRNATSFDWPDVDERSAAAMCYTSGTTGRPKGVVYSHRSMHLHSMAVNTGSVFAMSERDRVLPVVPMFHANAWGLPYAAVMAGASLIMPDRFLQPEPLVTLIEAERPTVAGAVPTIWNALLQHVRANGGDLSSLRIVPCGGSAVPHALLEAYEKELRVTILQASGMTTTSPLGSVAYAPVGATGEDAWRYRDTQGRLICEVEARLVGDAGTALPHDGEAVGEVEVRGPWITGAYYQDDDPAKFRDGWLRTGDVGTIDRLGYVVLTDRAKDVIKSGGGSRRWNSRTRSWLIPACSRQR